MLLLHKSQLNYHTAYVGEMDINRDIRNVTVLIIWKLKDEFNNLIHRQMTSFKLAHV